MNICNRNLIKKVSTTKKSGGWVNGWMGERMGGSKSSVKDCYSNQQSKSFICVCLVVEKNIGTLRIINQSFCIKKAFNFGAK